MVRNALTIGKLAEAVGAPVHRVRYAIITRRIEPVGSAARAWLYGEDAVEQVRAALEETGRCRMHQS